MTEPMLWNTPLSLLFLYFIFYSFLGWVMETVYCSVLERRLVPRGFLLGPICPIYGVGAILMIMPLSFFKDNLVVFYVVATVTLSAWEYFVGWLLEVTTHVKYWDYSRFKWNVKGRITLWICLWWGVLAYLAVFHIHPATEALFAHLSVTARQVLAAVLFVLLCTDGITTVRKLALTARLMRMLEEASEELHGRAREARGELQDRAEQAWDELTDRVGDALDDLREDWPEAAEALERLHLRYARLMDRAEQQSRRFRSRYRSSRTFRRHQAALAWLRRMQNREDRRK